MGGTNASSSGGRSGRRKNFKSWQLNNRWNFMVLGLTLPTPSTPLVRYTGRNNVTIEWTSPFTPRREHKAEVCPPHTDLGPSRGAWRCRHEGFTRIEDYTREEECLWMSCVCVGAGELHGELACAQERADDRGGGRQHDRQGTGHRTTGR